MAFSSSSSSPLHNFYTSYLSTLNDRKIPCPYNPPLSLSRYVHTNLTYNFSPLTLTEYEDIINQSVVSIPDLVYEVEWVVCQDEEGSQAVGEGWEEKGARELGGSIAAILRFKCTPEKEFMGYIPQLQQQQQSDSGEPGYRTIQFCEHVFYQVQNGKIVSVRSLIDKELVGSQLGYVAI